MSAAVAEALYTEGMKRENGVWREDPNYIPPQPEDELDAEGALASNDWTPEPPTTPDPDPYADLPPESRRLHERQAELMRLKENVVLSKRAERELAEIPAEIARIHAELDSAKQRNQALAYEYGERIDRVVSDRLIPAMRDYLDARDEIAAIQTEAAHQGVRPSGSARLEVRAQTDPELHQLLSRLRLG